MRGSVATLAALAALLAIAGVAAACEGLSPGDQLLNDRQQNVCTLAFVVANRDGLYFATAGHCGDVNETASQPPALDHDGRGTFGTFVFSHLDPRDGGPTGQQAGSPGNDFALIAIDPALWGEINPKVCELDGPTGIYEETPGSGNVRHYGYGTGIGDLPPTRSREGVLIENDNTAFFWVGAGVQGDSGSSVLHESGKALGVLTHLRISPANNGGTHLLRGFQLAEDAGFAPLRLVLAGEDPLQVLAELRGPQAAPPVAATPTGNATQAPTPDAPPSDSTAPASQAGAGASSANASGEDAASTEALVPAAAAPAGGERKVPGPGLAIVLVALAGAWLRRR